MKRLFGVIMSLALLAGAAAPAFAQTSHKVNGQRAPLGREFDGSRHAGRDRDGRRDYDRRHEGREDESVWEEHRDVITVAGGAGAGAVIGGLAGGKKGALIGALIGAGGSALYTYGIRDRDEGRDGRRYERRR